MIDGQRDYMPAQARRDVESLPPTDVPDHRRQPRHTRIPPIDQPRPPKPLGDDLIWAIYLQLSQAADSRLAEGWREELDVLLIFAGLFSAVVTAFIAESRKSLQADLQVTTNALLLQLVQLQSGTAPPLNANIFRPFKPSTSSLWVNGLWFASLTCSLASAGAAMLAKAWVREYSKEASADPRQAALDRQARYDATLTWHFSAVIAIIPLLIHIAFFLFFAGMPILLYSDNRPIAICMACVIALTTLLYLTSTLLPMWYPEIPFRTPLSTVLRYIAQTSFWRVVRKTYKRVHLRARRGNRRAVRWIREGPARQWQHTPSPAPPPQPQSDSLAEPHALAWLAETAEKTANLKLLVQAIARLRDGAVANVALAQPAVIRKLILHFRLSITFTMHGADVCYVPKTNEISSIKDCFSAIRMVVHAACNSNSSNVFEVLLRDIMFPLCYLYEDSLQADAFRLASDILVSACSTDSAHEFRRDIDSAAKCYFHRFTLHPDIFPAHSFVYTCNAITRQTPPVIEKTTATEGCAAIAAVIHSGPLGEELRYLNPMIKMLRVLYHLDPIPPSRNLDEAFTKLLDEEFVKSLHLRRSTLHCVAHSILILIRDLTVEEKRLGSRSHIALANGTTPLAVLRFVQNAPLVGFEEQDITLVPIVAQALIALGSIQAAAREGLSCSMAVKHFVVPEMERLMDNSTALDERYGHILGLAPFIEAIRQSLFDSDRYWNSVLCGKVRNWTGIVRQRLDPSSEETGVTLHRRLGDHVTIFAQLTLLQDDLQRLSSSKRSRDPASPVLIPFLATQNTADLSIILKALDSLIQSSTDFEIPNFLEAQGCERLASVIKHSLSTQTSDVISVLDALLLGIQLSRRDIDHFQPVWNQIREELPVMESKQASEWIRWMNRPDHLDGVKEALRTHVLQHFQEMNGQEMVGEGKDVTEPASEERDAKTTVSVYGAVG